MVGRNVPAQRLHESGTLLRTEGLDRDAEARATNRQRCAACRDRSGARPLRSEKAPLRRLEASADGLGANRVVAHLKRVQHVHGQCHDA